MAADERSPPILAALRVDLPKENRGPSAGLDACCLSDILLIVGIGAWACCSFSAMRLFLDEAGATTRDAHVTGGEKVYRGSGSDQDDGRGR